MQNFSSSPKEMLESIWRNRELITTLVKREVLGRYRGSLMGILWTFINPVFMLTIYTFVFSIVFKARWNEDSESKTEFALILFAGLIIFNLVSECVNRAPGLILANVNYVKKVIFPLEILPVVSLGTALFHAMISFIVWLLVYGIFFGMPHLTTLLVPMVIIPLLFFILGISWILAALGVYVRDISQFVGMVMTVLMFLSPIFYPITAIPERYRFFIQLNPISPAIEQIRQVLYWGEIPSPEAWGICFLASLVVAILGFTWFQKTRKGFSDVL
jgi:lipopolysaccharide transport system permease protein